MDLSPFGSISNFGTILGFLGGTFATLSGVYLRSRVDTKRTLDEQVHRPLYNEVKTVADGDLPEDLPRAHTSGSPVEYQSQWDRFEEYQRMKADSSLSCKMEAYTTKLDQLNEILRELNENELGFEIEQVLDEEGMNRLAQTFREQFPEDALHEPDGGRREFLAFHTGSTTWEINGFLKYYGHVLLAAENPDDLKTKVEVYWNEVRGNYGSFIHELNHQYPEWPSWLWVVQQELDGEFEAKMQPRIDLLDRRDRLRMEIQNSAESLVEELEMRIAKTRYWLLPGPIRRFCLQW